MPLQVWRIGFTEVKCDGCGRVERREERPSGYHLLLKLGWREQRQYDHVELFCPRCTPRAA
jgi:hypothetical protein